MENLFEKACNYALEKHSGQHRKDGSIYILHPFEVATIAGSITTNEEILSRVLVSRYEIDMPLIKEMYEYKYNISLKDHIIDDTSGMYQKLCLFLVSK